MAQIVKYSQDNIEYQEGPFVVCQVTAGGYRLECELKKWHTSVLPDLTIYKFADEKGLELKSRYCEKIEKIADRFNLLVCSETIVLENNWWVYKGI